MSLNGSQMTVCRTEGAAEEAALAELIRPQLRKRSLLVADHEWSRECFTVSQSELIRRRKLQKPNSYYVARLFAFQNTIRSTSHQQIHTRLKLSDPEKAAQASYLLS